MWNFPTAISSSTTLLRSESETCRSCSSAFSRERTVAPPSLDSLGTTVRTGTSLFGGGCGWEGGPPILAMKEDTSSAGSVGCDRGARSYTENCELRRGYWRFKSRLVLGCFRDIVRDLIIVTTNAVLYV